MKNAVELNGLSKQFGHMTALKDVSLTVRKGEVFGFLGPNGAGKTTTIRAMLNLIRPTEGSISLLDMDSRRDYVKLHHKIGYLAGDMNMFNNLRAEQYIGYMANLYGQVESGRIALLVRDLQADLKPKIKNLSRGNKQKIGLIVALMHNPDLLILDEPTTGLDPLMQEVFYKLLEEHTKNGGTTFMSSHNLSEVQRVCDRVAFIRGGELIEVSTVRKLRSSSLQQFEVSFDKRPDDKALAKLKSVKELTWQDDVLVCTVAGELTEFLKAITPYGVTGITNRELELEEVFMKLYGELPV